MRERDTRSRAGRLCSTFSKYIMDLFRNMRIFARVTEEMSYTSAAHAFNISTGAVSRLVSELEQHLSTRLLHRTTRQIALTHAGRLYLEKCRAILDAIGEAEAEARSIHLQPTGCLRVRASPSLGRSFLIPAIKEYQRKYPTVQLALTFEESTSQSLEERFDTAILALPRLRDSSLVGVQLGETYSVLCAAPIYLGAHSDLTAPSELEAHAFVSDSSTFVDSAELELYGPEGPERALVRPSLCVNSLASVAAALELGMGVGALPLHAAMGALQSGCLVRVLPKYHLEKLKIYALFASKLFLDAKIRTWLDHLKAFFAEASQRQNALHSGH